MKQQNFFILFALLAAIQVLLTNYFNVSPYVMPSILPVMVLCIPTRIGTPWAMVIAFATGLLVDIMADGLLGINAFSLVPVALVRLSVCRFVFGEELISRQDNFSVRKYGIGKVLFAIAIVHSIFLILYLWADGAGTRTFAFNALRFAGSLAAGLLLSVFVAEILTPDDRK